MTSSVLTSPTSPSKILNLLSARETRGVVPPSARGARGPAQVEYRANRYVRMEDLASAIAWYVTPHVLILSFELDDFFV